MGYAPVYFTNNDGSQVESDQIVFDGGKVFARGATEVGQTIVESPSWSKEGKLTKEDGVEFVRSLSFSYRGTRLRVGRYVEQSERVKAWGNRIRGRADFVMAINGRYRVKAFDPSEPRDDHGRWTDGGGVPAKITDIPSTRAGQLELLSHVGTSTRSEYIKDFRDDLIRSLVERRVQQHNETIRLTALTPVDAIAPQLTMLQREMDDVAVIAKKSELNSVDTKALERITQVKIDALLARRDQLGVTGTAAAKIDRSTLSYKPASTIKEAEDFWNDKGVRAKFDVPRDAVSDIEGWDDSKTRWSLHEINEINAGLVGMVKQYPSFDLKSVGMMYALDKDNWDQSFTYNMEKERIAFEKSGKSRFVKTAAEKRVRKLMISEPPKGDMIGADHQYDIFVAAQASERMRMISFNHRAHFLVDSVAQANQERTEARNGGRPASNVATDPKSIAIHEAAHILDYSYGLSKHERIKSLFESLDNPEGKDRIKKEISAYAASSTKHDETQGNIVEFVAEAYLESTFPEPSPLAKQVRGIIDDIVAETDRGKDVVS